MKSTEWLAYCRAGFEPECAQELAAEADRQGLVGYVRAKVGDGYARFIANESALGDLEVSRLVFARQILLLRADFAGLLAGDRLGPIRAWLEHHPGPYADVFVEAPDSDAGAELRGFTRSFEAVVLAALRQLKALSQRSPRRLHVFFPSTTHAFLADADTRRSSPHRMGIPRFRLGKDAPSRSALKIEEALLTMLADDERERWLKPGMTAVDLGAAPGGWTWQLAKKSLRVTAIDNGPLAPHVLDMPVVTHLREDGFRWRPKKPVDWLVCDMVEQPIRVASLIASWLRDRDCRFALFNLKLPMKKRYLEVQRCLEALREESGLSLDVRAKQLYHDREEITVFARAL